MKLCPCGKMQSLAGRNKLCATCWCKREQRVNRMAKKRAYKPKRRSHA